MIGMRNVGIMKRRLALLQKMISSSDTLKRHWKKETVHVARTGVL